MGGGLRCELIATYTTEMTLEWRSTGAMGAPGGKWGQRTEQHVQRPRGEEGVPGPGAQRGAVEGRSQAGMQGGQRAVPRVIWGTVQNTEGGQGAVEASVQRLGQGWPLGS